jgi:hypothetical protein
MSVATGVACRGREPLDPTGLEPDGVQRRANLAPYRPPVRAGTGNQQFVIHRSLMLWACRRSSDAAGRPAWRLTRPRRVVGMGPCHDVHSSWSVSKLRGIRASACEKVVPAGQPWIIALGGDVSTASREVGVANTRVATA